VRGSLFSRRRWSSLRRLPKSGTAGLTGFTYANEPDTPRRSHPRAQLRIWSGVSACSLCAWHQLVVVLGSSRAEQFARVRLAGDDGGPPDFAGLVFAIERSSKRSLPSARPARGTEAVLRENGADVASN